MIKTKRREDHDVLKEAYENARKRYGLIPTFEQLDKEFEITMIDPDRVHFIVKDVKRTICSKLHKFIDYIVPIINPSPSSLHSMIETKFFDKDELDEMFEFYKRLWYFLHKAILVGLRSEKDEAALINEIWTEWPKIKDKMNKYMDRITDGWAKEEKEEKREVYLG